MIKNQKSLRTCEKGHEYYKSSDCPVCPICAAEQKPDSGLLSTLAAPARRALQSKGISTALELARHTEAEVMQLHGIGRSSLPKLLQALEAEGLAFKS
jgi:predicted RecB family nuclease